MSYVIIGQTGIIDIRARKTNGQSTSLNAGAVWSVNDPSLLSLVPTANNRAANVTALKEGNAIVRVTGTADFGQGDRPINIELTLYILQPPPSHPVHTPGAELVFTPD